MLREDSMILTFHVPPQTRGLRLYDFVSLEKLNKNIKKIGKFCNREIRPIIRAFPFDL